MNRQADGTSTLTLGRNQDKDLLVYDQAELVLGVADRPVGILSTLISYSLSGGWFRQHAVAAETSRLQYVVGLSMPTVALTATTSWEASASWQDAVYGTRMRQSALRLDATYTIVVSEQSSLKLSYDRLGVFGATPFNFDAIDPKFITNDLSFESFRTWVRADDVTTTFHYGISYSFLDQAPVLVIGHKEEAPERFPWGLDVEYDPVTKDAKVTADSKFAIGLGTDFSVHAIYHTSTGLFDDLDYLLTSHLFDCANLELQYRQVKQEFSLDIDMRPCDP
jgi:hypothetical protein